MIIERPKAGYGETMTVAISLPVYIVREIEDRRGFDSRSRYILRAVDRYLREEEEEQEEQKGVEVLPGHQPQSTNTTPTPTPTNRPQDTTLKEVMM